MRIGIRLLAVAILMSAVAACGDKFDNSPSAPAAAKVTLTGSVSGMVAKPSSKPANGGDGVLHSPVAGGEIKVIDSKGKVIATAKIKADGTYKVNIDMGSNYVVKATKGNVCLKAFIEKADTDKSVTVDPTSSAIVKVLAIKIGNDKLGDEGEDVSSVTSSSNISAIIAEISVSAVLTQIAAAIQDDIAANADYSATTVTVGIVSTAGDGEANSVALTITITITITDNGQVISAPATPAGVSLTAGDGQVTISWGAVAGATSYNVYYSTVAGVAGIKINGITTGTSYTLTGLTNGTAYYFIVTASKAGLESIGSTQLNTTPQLPVAGAPAGVTATSGNGQALISWTAVTGAASYNIYWKTSSGVTTGNGTKISNITATSYTLTGLTNGTTYYFVVTAVNVGGESAASSEVAATPQVAAPSAPTGVIAIAGDSTVSLSWTAVSGATCYIYRSDSSGAQGSLLGTSSAASYTDSTAVNGNTYYYTVTAVNAGGQSSGSGQVSATPLAPTPATSTGAGYDEILYDADAYE